MSGQLTPEQQAHWNDSRQPTLYGVLGVLLVLSNTSLAARIFSVLRQRGKFYVEDYFVITAVVLSDGIIGALLAATHMGFGLHEYRVMAEDPDPPMRLLHIFQIIWAYAVMNGFCFITLKMSIMFFYKRLFFVERWFKIAWWINVTYAVCWFFGSTLFYIFQCTPVDFYWTRLGGLFPNPKINVDPNGKCVSSIASIGTPIMLNTVNDVVILLMPVPALFKLHLSLQKRLRLIFLLSIGLIASASGFVRFAFIFKSPKTSDQTYTPMEFLLWSDVELVLGIMCANIPLIVSYVESRKKAPNTVVKKPSNSSGESSEGFGGGFGTSTVRSHAARHPYVELDGVSARMDPDRSSQSGDDLEMQRGINVRTNIQQTQVYHAR